jgi:hypothetical protein
MMVHVNNRLSARIGAEAWFFSKRALFGYAVPAHSNKNTDLTHFRPIQSS